MHVIQDVYFDVFSPINKSNGCFDFIWVIVSKALSVMEKYSHRGYHTVSKVSPESNKNVPFDSLVGKLRS